MKPVFALCPLLLAHVALAAEKPKTPTPPPVKGAVQMAGDNGQIGTTYTIGATGPLNFTLNSAEFTATRALFGEATIAPKSDEKLLLLKGTIHNPNKDLTGFDWGTLRFTAIDPNDANHEYENAVAKMGSNEVINVELKPAQKMDVFYVIRVPIKGPIPKLMVAHQSGGKVLRYDLRKVAKALPAPFADSADASGATGLSEIKSEVGTFYPLQNFDVKLVGTTFQDGKLGEFEPEEGKRFLVATVVIKNAGATAAYYDASTFAAALTDGEGEKSDSMGFLKTTRPEGASGDLKPGAEYTGRFFFALPKDGKAKTLSLSEGESRTFHFDVSNTK